jgi:hypothetical protein
MVHAAVVHAVGEDLAVSSCSLYALGMFRFLSDEGYVIQFGTAMFATGHEDVAIGFDVEAARESGTAGLEFHAWLARPVGRVRDGYAEDLEIVDASARHAHTRAASSGIPWTHGPLGIIHDRASALRARGFIYKTDLAATEAGKAAMMASNDHRAFLTDLAGRIRADVDAHWARGEKTS